MTKDHLVTDPTRDEIDLAVVRLTRALARARASQGGEVQDEVAQQGAEFVRALHGTLRMTRVHDLDNQAFERPLEELQGLLRALVGILGAVSVSVVEGQVYLGQQRLRTDERAQVGVALSRELRRHDCGGIVFHDILQLAALRAFLAAFSASPDEGRPRSGLRRKLDELGLQSVELLGTFRFQLDEDPDQRERTEGGDRIELARQGAALVDQTWDNLGQRRLPDTVAVRRVVAQLVHQGEGSEPLLEDLAGSSPYAAHTIRVCHVALMIGRALGLDAGELQDLGVTALMHDLGYAAREGAERGPDGRIVFAGYAPPFERHGTAGARLMLRRPGFHPAQARRMLAILQHHKDASDKTSPPSLHARILRIAEDYDNLQRPRGGDMTPPEAVARMAAHGGTFYDPVLLQLFINTMGRYPPGSVLRLEDGRVVQVRSTVRGPSMFETPLTEVLRDARGKEPREPQYVDLAREGAVAQILRPV